MISRLDGLGPHLPNLVVFSEGDVPVCSTMLLLIRYPFAAQSEPSYDLFVTPRQKKYEIVVRCAKVER